MTDVKFRRWETPRINQVFLTGLPEEQVPHRPRKSRRATRLHTPRLVDRAHLQHRSAIDDSFDHGLGRYVSTAICKLATKKMNFYNKMPRNNDFCFLRALYQYGSQRGRDAVSTGCRFPLSGFTHETTHRPSPEIHSEINRVASYFMTTRYMCDNDKC